VTTMNHTLVAGTVAVMSENLSASDKIVVVTVLFLSHLALDMLPHKHFGNYRNIKGCFPQFLAEIVLGVVILPLLIWQISSLNLAWLLVYVCAANLIDALLVIGWGPVVRVNDWTHKWEGQISLRRLRIFEFIQTFVVAGLFLTVLWLR